MLACVALASGWVDGVVMGNSFNGDHFTGPGPEEHYHGCTQMNDNDEIPVFARGVAGPLGKLDMDLKTKVDEGTYDLFCRQCRIEGVDVSGVLRDFVYAYVYQKTYGQMVAEKMSHDAHRIDAIKRLIGHVHAPEFLATGER